MINKLSLDKKNKKYILWNEGIFPIAEIVRNTTFDDDFETHDRY